MMPFSRAKRDAGAGVQLRSAARTHIGHVRTVNEDRILDCPAHQLWAIADGMGGHSQGDRAATVVVRALACLADDAQPITSGSIGTALSSANKTIWDLGNAQTCGSTIAGLHIAGTLCTIFWAGDSRIYRLRGGRLQRLTRDHSHVQQLTDAGLITAAQARNHPQANVITRAVGVSPVLEVDYEFSELIEDDMFLLCSDGLSSLVEDNLLEQLIEPDIAHASTRLLDQALRAGGTDNISLILVHSARGTPRS